MTLLCELQAGDSALAARVGFQLRQRDEALTVPAPDPATVGRDATCQRINSPWSTRGIKAAGRQTLTCGAANVMQGRQTYRSRSMARRCPFCPEACSSAWPGPIAQGGKSQLLRPSCCLPQLRQLQWMRVACPGIASAIRFQQAGLGRVALYRPCLGAAVAEDNTRATICDGPGAAAREAGRLCCAVHVARVVPTVKNGSCSMHAHAS